MPELPEVETIRRYLYQDIIGKTIKDIDIRVAKQFISQKERVIGKKIVDIQRKGKIIIIKFTHLLFLNIHLKLTGQLVFAKEINQKYKTTIPHANSNSLPAKTTRIIIYFTDSSVLYFNDLRKFGWMKVTDKPEQPKGIDVLSKDFTLKYFNSLVHRSPGKGGLTHKTNKPIKLLLMDQDKICGIGNIYANDALYIAKIHPLKKSKSLSDEEIKRLYQAIKQTINQGLKYHGSSDESYILPDASVGHYQNHFKAYGREKKPCSRCRTLIRRIKHHGRSSFFCPNCQPAPPSF